MVNAIFSKGFKQLGVGMIILTFLFLAACGGNSNTSSSNNSNANSNNGSANSGSSETPSTEPIKIGAILSFTGPFAALSNDVKEGLDLFLEQNNNMIGGRSVEIKYEDDEGSPQVALRKYRQLTISDNVDVMVAPLLSNVAYALRDEADKDKMIMIIPNAAADGISWEAKSDYIFRVSLSNWQGGTSAGAYIAENVGKKAITVANDYSAGKEHIMAFKAAFEAAGGEVVDEIYAPIGTNDYGPFVTEIANQKPEVVYSFLGGNEAIRLVQSYNDFGLKGQIPFTGSPEYGDMIVISATGEAAEGIISGVFYTPWLENDLNKSFVEAYQAKYNKLPNMFSVQGYDAAQVLDAAITEAGSVDSEDLKEALKGITWDSPRGTLSLDPNTNNVIQNFYIAKNVNKDGQIIPEVLETVEKVTMPETKPAE